jgi:putative addiction module component (TIGR02574 family)
VDLPMSSWMDVEWHFPAMRDPGRLMWMTRTPWSPAMSIEQLEAEAMKLSPEERERLGEKLLGSVPCELEFESEWAEEIDRRVQEIRRGDVTPVSSGDMFKDALDSLR